MDWLLLLSQPKVSSYTENNRLTEFVFHGHDNFNMIQRVQTNIIDEVRVQG